MNSSMFFGIFYLFLAGAVTALAPQGSSSTPSLDNRPASTVSSRRAWLQQQTGRLLMGAAAAAAGATGSPSAAHASVTGSIHKIQYGDESIMRPKKHGTSDSEVQSQLLYGVDRQLADRIVNYNRHFAEYGGYFRTTEWEEKVMKADGPLTYYDSVTGEPLFVAPINRSKEEFLAESRVHGWPSFRDDEVVWENVRVLRNSGETVSTTGSHLGHNLPDRRGNRYCINLVSVAGQPAVTTDKMVATTNAAASSTSTSTSL